ncbi:MAG: hypothetical protein Q8Q07_06105 [Dehalococcoidales bacterium]|nr:hypothetical protein [Dehalococcoidales bacterium]
MPLLKLSKRSWILIAAVVFAIASTYLGVVHLQQVQQQNRLDEQFEQIQTKLENVKITRLISRKAELETQLGEAKVQLETAQIALSRPVESSMVTRALFDVAEAHSLEVIQMTSSSPSKANLEGADFSLLTLTARIEGSAPNLINFIIDLNTYFGTSVVKSVTINIPEDSGKATVDVMMVIYIYQEG